MRTIAGIACLAAFVTAFLAGCVTMPLSEDAKADAKGTITVSTPLFTPIVAKADHDRRLAFGDYRSESSLIEAIHKSQLGQVLLQSDTFEQALALSLPTVERVIAESGYLREGDRANWRQHGVDSTTTTRSGAPPESVPQQVDTVLGSLVDTLAVRSGGIGKHLSPDVVASLVTAYKTYMVNLEEYTNLDGYDFQNARRSPYRPYKVHFTVTVEPGWYTRYHQYDAVVELKLGIDLPGGIRVMSVAPAETSQTIDALTAQFTRLALSLEVAGTLDGIGLRDQARQLSETAARLEGLRSHNTMVAAFADQDVIRVRFRAAQVATAEAQDLQPISRMMTAVVMVPFPAAEREPVCAETDAGAKAKVEERSAEGVFEAELTAFAEAAGVEREPEARPARLPGLSLVTVGSRFEPALRDRAGDFKPRRTFLSIPVTHRPLDRFELREQQRGVEIPEWSSDYRREFELVQTTGFYYADFADVAHAEERAKVHEAAIAKLQSALKDEEAKLKAGLDAEVECGKGVREAEREVAAAEAGLAKARDALTKHLEGDPKGEKQDVRANLQKAVVEAGARVRRARETADAALTRCDALAQRRAAIEGRVEDLHKECTSERANIVHWRRVRAHALRAALREGAVAVGYEIRAPRRRMVADKCRNVTVVARLTGLDAGAVHVFTLGEGDVAGAFEVRGVDLTDVVVEGEAGYLKNLHVVLEVRLVAGTDVLESRVTDLVVRPRLDAKAKSTPSSPSKGLSVELKGVDAPALQVVDLGVQLKAAAKSPTEPPATGKPGELPKPGPATPKEENEKPSPPKDAPKDAPKEAPKEE